MFWLIAIPVLVIVAALVWWSSGRAKPLGTRQDPHANPEVAKAIAKAQSYSFRSSGGGFGRF